jgi:AGZA family xanthine/uracil permease-like MFS transporter
LFGVRASGSTIGRELVAGFTTFGAMSYIVVVNPAILSATGMDLHALIITTALAAMVGTLIMALSANLPIALAPGMGSNIVFAQVVVLRLGVSYQTALAMVMTGGCLFVLLSVTRFRARLVQGFPDSIRLGMQCGIGLFIAYLGLKNGGLVVQGAHGVSFGHLRDPAVMLVFLGMLATPVLTALRVPAALLLSIVVLTLVGLLVPGAHGHPVTAMPHRLLDWPSLPRGLLLALDFHQFITHFFVLLPIALYFFLSDFFSATATLIGVTRRAGLMDAEGRIPNAQRAFIADGAASMVGALLGTSTVAAYVESAAGVEAGGRTGLTAVVVAILFGLSLFFWPIIAIIPPQATAPALVLVGVLMMEGIRDIDTSRPENAIPPILILLLVVVTTDLMMGLASGCFVYTLIVLATRQWRKLTGMLLAVDAVLVLYVVLINTTM